jgi:alkylhydroperoxidase family enzyme
MSENLTLDHTPTTTIPRRTQSFPVGARFPRTWPSNVQLAVDTAVRAAAEHPAPLFPVGRRFWRPTPEEIEAAAASEAALRSQPPRVLPHPIGARFPRTSAASRTRR